MAHAPIPADTDRASYALLVERWRSMSIHERAELIEKLCIDVEQFARSDISARHPEFTEVEVCHELARRRYGDKLANAAYEELLAR